MKFVPNVGDINVVDTIPDNSFVKPQHKLLELLNNVSSADKLYLVNVVSRNSFTKSTLSPELNEKITSLLKIVIGSINNVSETDFYIKNIDNLYVLKYISIMQDLLLMHLFMILKIFIQSVLI